MWLMEEEKWKKDVCNWRKRCLKSSSVRACEVFSFFKDDLWAWGLEIHEQHCVSDFFMLLKDLSVPVFDVLICDVTSVWGTEQ